MSMSRWRQPNRHPNISSLFSHLKLRSRFELRELTIVHRKAEAYKWQSQFRPPVFILLWDFLVLFVVFSTRSNVLQVETFPTSEWLRKKRQKRKEKKARRLRMQENRYLRTLHTRYAIVVLWNNFERQKLRFVLMTILSFLLL